MPDARRRLRRPERGHETESESVSMTIRSLSTSGPRCNIVQRSPHRFSSLVRIRCKTSPHVAKHVAKWGISPRWIQRATIARCEGIERRGSPARVRRSSLSRSAGAGCRATSDHGARRARDARRCRNARRARAAAPLCFRDGRRRARARVAARARRASARAAARRMSSLRVATSSVANDAVRAMWTRTRGTR